MSYISLLLPAFHINTNEINEVQRYCSSQFNIPLDKFEVIEIMDNSNNTNFAIKFNESNFSLKSIEDLIYQRNCMQSLSEKMFESLKLMTTKLNDIINSINGKEIKIQNKDELINDNIKLKELLASQIEYSDNFRMNTEMTLNKIKDEFKIMVNELNTLKKNTNARTDDDIENLGHKLENINQNNNIQKVKFTGSSNNIKDKIKDNIIPLKVNLIK